MTGRRVTLICAGKPKRKVVFPEAPFPRIGETVVDETTGLDWLVVGTEDTEIIARIPFPAKTEAEC